MSRVNEGRRDMSKGKVPCASCHEMKERDQFQKCKKKKFGLQTYCKTCQLKKVKNPNSTLDRIYIGQMNSKDVMHYTKQEMKDWAIANGFNELYNTYVNNDYDKSIIPSIDRIDVRKDFTLDNIQLITWDLKLLKKSVDSFLTSDTRGVRKVGSRRTPSYCVQQTIDGIRVVKHYKTYLDAMSWKRARILDVTDVLDENNIKYPEVS